MVCIRFSITKILSAAVVVTCAVAAFHTAPAAAQSATSLNCKQCVKSKQLKNNGIKSRDIKNGQVKNPDLGTGAVTGNKIANGAVGSSQVAPNSVPAADLLNEAGAAFAGGNQSLVLTVSSTVVRSVTITAPSSGVVIVNASGLFGLSTSGIDTVECSITTGTTTDNAYTIGATDLNFSVISTPFAGVRGFTVGPGSTTFRLVCRKVNGDVGVYDSQMTALFVPTMY